MGNDDEGQLSKNYSEPQSTGLTPADKDNTLGLLSTLLRCINETSERLGLATVKESEEKRADTPKINVINQSIKTLIMKSSSILKEIKKL